MSEVNQNAATQDPWSTSAAPAADPWSAASTPATATDPWGAAAAAPDAAAPATDWLASPASATPDAPLSLWEQLQTDGLPIEAWINQGLGWVVDNFRPFFQAVRAPIDATLSGVEQLMLALPWPLLTLFVALVAWQFAGRGLAIGTALSLIAIAALGIWPEAMVTLSLVLTSLAFCIVIGLPLGVLIAASDRAQR